MIERLFKLHPSLGNIKMGKRIGNISLLPGVTCRADAPCRHDCYAKKALHRPTVRTAWEENTAYAIGYPVGYFSEVDAWIQKKKIDHFRWHVAGDIPDQPYLRNMMKVALNNPTVKFLAFTKKFDLDYSACPPNLTIIFSMWPGLAVPSRKPGVAAFAWMQDGTETRHPLGAKACKGTCDSCFSCWGTNTDVIFKKH